MILLLYVALTGVIQLYPGFCWSGLECARWLYLHAQCLNERLITGPSWTTLPLLVVLGPSSIVSINGWLDFLPDDSELQERFQEMEPASLLMPGPGNWHNVTSILFYRSNSS